MSGNGHCHAFAVVFFVGRRLPYLYLHTHAHWFPNKRLSTLLNDYFFFQISNNIVHKIPQATFIEDFEQIRPLISIRIFQSSNQWGNDILSSNNFVTIFPNWYKWNTFIRHYSKIQMLYEIWSSGRFRTKHQTDGVSDAWTLSISFTSFE